VPRPRLHARLTAGVRGRLTLLSAPPGAGKTVVLLSWLAASRRRADVAWLSLTERHDDPEAFWDDVATGIAAATGSGTREAGRDGVGIRSALEEPGRPLTLVLDDFQELRSPAVRVALARLVRKAPERLSVVVASRQDPDLELHRFRLDGDLTEIRARDLAFTEGEAAALFASDGVELAAEHVAALVHRTEGWAAALRFAALSIRERSDVASFVAAFERSEQAVSDYLVREVLVSLPADEREFLLRTSICDRICGPLADALTGRSDGARTLAALERENLFVEPLPAGVWYRYHRLFAELLRAEAGYELGGGLAAVHADAARWLAADGHPLDALRHAVAAGDAELADSLLAGLWLEVAGRGQIDLASELLERVAPDEVRSRANLSVLAAFERVGSGELAEAGSWLAHARDLVSGLSSSARRGAELGLAVVGLALARLEGDLDGLEAATLQLSEPDALVLGRRDNECRRALALCSCGAIDLWRGDLEVAMPSLERALEASRRLQLADCELDAASLLALGHAVRGELKRADRLGTAGLAFTGRNRRWGGSPHLVPAAAALALCAFERDDVDSGERHLDEARRAALASGDRIGQLVPAAVAAWSIGRRSAEATEEARLDLARAGGPDAVTVPPLLGAPLRILGARLELASGDFDAAAERLREGSAAELTVARARLQLAQGDLEEATAALDAVTGGCEPMTWSRVSVEAAVLRALTSVRSGDTDGARAWLERALDRAEPEGLRGPFLDAGPGLAELLRIAIRNGTAHRWLAAELLSSLGGESGEPGALPRELLEPLSAKEQVVLRYLPTLMSNQEIAGELYVSVNTVKTHLKSIYRKLGVTHRRDAVGRARELRLLG